MLRQGESAKVNSEKKFKKFQKTIYTIYRVLYP